MHGNYNSRLRPFARQMRNEGTKSEACLWKYLLRARQMRGYAFKRQRPVLHYIADFMCAELMLVIEVDGSIHERKETIQRDRKKDADLQALGYTVLRFTNDEVLHHIQYVKAKLEEWIEEKEKS